MHCDDAVSFVGKFKELISRSGSEQENNASRFVYVKIPEDIMPLEREDKYEGPLNAILVTKQLGKVTGAGSQLGADRADGSRSIEFCGLDIDLLSLPNGLIVLQEQLVAFGTPIGTQIHYTIAGQKLQDELTSDGWLNRQIRTFLHPGFGV